MWTSARAVAIAVVTAATVLAGGSPVSAEDADTSGPFTCSPTAQAFVTAPGADTVGVYAAGDSKLLCLPFSVTVTVVDTTSGQGLYSGTMAATSSFQATFTVPRGDTVLLTVQQHFSQVQASASPVPVAPSAVTSLVASAATQTTMQLDWVVPSSDGGAPITGYLVTWNGGSVPASSTEVVVTGLAPGTTYAFAVTALNSAGSSDAATVTATTAAKPTPPAPGPPPNPQPVVITPVTVAVTQPGNIDGSVDTDASVRTIQQTVPGTWPKRTRLVSGTRLTLGRLALLRTNAGQQAVLSVTYLSPSIRSTSVSIDGRGRLVGVTATLKQGTRSGAIVLTVSAGPVSAGDVEYEGIQASRRFTVRPA